ncbi:TetR/AcrR family transcriptional regulator [Rhodopseudomonas pseudopalustris]|nr:TetR/AcrR family transcriptional regulator [Rhodopseudomonas pseudopalustris]SEP34607.1 transcriptional regulator, TetR family [Rhodopseudomonas pseudopalustris]
MTKNSADSARPRGLVQVRSSRADKQERTRRALLQAAIDIVGDEGYAAATVGKITSRAKVANGTFYNYFDSQQSIFDQLLPFLGDRLTAHIKAQVDESLTGVARDRARFVAYFDFCRKNPAFLRVLNEAEVFAATAYRQHVVAMYEGYLHALERSAAKHEITGYDREELPPVVFMLMGIRSYMTMLYQHNYVERSALSIEAMADIYEKLLTLGLFNDRR